MFAVIAHGEVTCGRIACSVVNAAPAFALANATSRLTSSPLGLAANCLSCVPSKPVASAPSAST